MIGNDRPVVANERLKASVPTLAGTIARALADPALDRFAEDDIQFLKFHGIYQQDDRDLRKSGKKYLFMIRGRIPGGVLPSEMYLALDRLATAHGNDTLRITSRQSLQFHGVVKSGLGPLMRGIHEALSTTLAACGDVARNVMAPPTPARDGLGAQVLQDARAISDALLPQTRAYHAIWVEGVQLDLDDPRHRAFTDPLYGKTYLPRKFKVAFAVPPLNDTDVLTNCLGLIAIAEGTRLVGYNVAVGGGLGMSHGNAETYPRLADVLGFIPAGSAVELARAVVAVYRDWGDRTNRRHARLKYVLAERGAAWFRAELEPRLGFALETARPYTFAHQGDLFGWHSQQDGRRFLGLFVETGRIADRGSVRLKTALREVIQAFRPEIRLTPSQNLILAGVDPADEAAITRLLGSHGLAVEAPAQGSPLRRASMACVALPTCGLALAESERYLPGLITQLETVLRELGLADEEITVRLTGCPNGCARPYGAEIGLVGRAPGRYQVYVGGNEASTRLNRVFRDNVREADLVPELRALLQRFAAERQPGERFGDWSARVIWPSLNALAGPTAPAPAS